MAGDWMKIELELPDKPEVHAIAATLNIDPDAVVGKLIRVWQWFDKHTVDGNAFGVTFSLPDRISGVTGFGEAMMFAGWLEQKDKMLVMPGFDKHTSTSAKARALTAKRVAKSKSKSIAVSNGASVTEALPREEKRREDINTLVTVKPVDDCPHEQIVALYHELLPELPSVKLWNDKRKALLRSRWREDKERQDLDYWRRFFKYIGTSDFLMGRAGDFQANLAWVLKAENFVKIIEGNYENRKAA